MKIKVGDYEVLDSGSVISFKDQPILFELSHGGEEVNLKLVFAETTKTDEKGNPVDSSEFNLTADASITLRGWDNPMGVAFPNPVRLGTIGGKPLLLLLRSYGMINQKNRMVSFTWLLGSVENAPK